MFGINGLEFVVILVIAVLIVGPERLPQYAEQLARAVRRVKVLLQDAKSRVDDELGPELGDVDWSRLDPRQYDPRRIVRDALLEDTPFDANRARAGAPAAAGGAARVAGTPSGEGVPGRAPYDDEAT